MGIGRYQKEGIKRRLLKRGSVPPRHLLIGPERSRRVVRGHASATLALPTVAGKGVIDVPMDGPSNWFVPTTDAHWNALATINPLISVPEFCYGHQDASGNLAEVNAGTVLTAINTPLYQQTVAGWTRKFTGTNDNSNAGFRHGTGVGTDPSATSVAWLFLWAFNGSTTRYCLQLGQKLVVKTFSNNKIQVSDIDHAAVSGSADYLGLASVHYLLIVHDKTNSLIRTYTDLEQLNGPAYQALADGTAKGPYSNEANRAATRHGLTAHWKGAAAEALDKSVIATLINAPLPY